jgi:hypothetical protein
VRRLDECGHLKEVDYALVILEKSEDGAMMTTGVCLSGIFLALQRPELYSEPPAWVLKVAPALSSPNNVICRVPYDRRWDYISRAVLNKRRPKQVFVEVKLDLSTNTLH